MDFKLESEQTQGKRGKKSKEVLEDENTIFYYRVIKDSKCTSAEKFELHQSISDRLTIENDDNLFTQFVNIRKDDISKVKYVAKLENFERSSQYQNPIVVD